MASRFLCLLLLAGSWTLAGCNQSARTEMADADLPVEMAANSPANLRLDSGPDEVVTAFLDAARSGNESLATQLLTRKAQVETAKEGLSLDPPGTPAMKFRIEKVEFVEDIKDAAYVNSVWSDPAAGPTEDPFEVVWVLRKQSDGWRIAGMAAQLEPGEPPTFLNFEEPDDVLKLKGQLNDEPSREQRGSVRQASYEEPAGPDAPP